MSRDPASRIEQALRRVERDDIHSLGANVDDASLGAEDDDLDDDDDVEAEDSPQIR